MDSLMKSALTGQIFKLTDSLNEEELIEAINASDFVSENFKKLINAAERTIDNKLKVPSSESPDFSGFLKFIESINDSSKKEALLSPYFKFNYKKIEVFIDNIDDLINVLSVLDKDHHAYLIETLVDKKKLGSIIKNNPRLPDLLKVLNVRQ
jgi:hypothetical protein